MRSYKIPIGLKACLAGMGVKGLMKHKDRILDFHFIKSLLPTLCFLIVNILMANAYAEKINVAVAANFTTAMRDLTKVFEKVSGHRVEASYGSSGKLYAQINHGAPFQIFFSADQSKPQALINHGLADPKSLFTYAQGALVLWSGKSDLIDSEGKVLFTDRYNKLALANPKLAPYGEAAVQVLENLNLLDQTKKKWVRGENIAQTFQFVSTANADLGFVALSQIIDREELQKGSSWIVPNHLHQPIRQDVVLLNTGADSPAAKAFLLFVKSPQARKIIQLHGYTLNNLIE